MNLPVQMKGNRPRGWPELGKRGGISRPYQLCQLLLKHAIYFLTFLHATATTAATMAEFQKITE